MSFDCVMQVARARGSICIGKGGRVVDLVRDGTEGKDALSRVVSGGGGSGGGGDVFDRGGGVASGDRVEIGYDKAPVVFWMR